MPLFNLFFEKNCNPKPLDDPLQNYWDAINGKGPLLDYYKQDTYFFVMDLLKAIKYYEETNKI